MLQISRPFVEHCLIFSHHND